MIGEKMDNTKSNKPLISIKNLKKVFRMGKEKVVALNGINLEINQGEFVCFLGKSGSGKSTFLNMVAGLEKPSAGEIYIGKVPIHKLTEDELCLFRQKNTGFIFQTYNLIPTLTAIENVAMPLVFMGYPKEKSIKIAKKYIDKVGLKGYYKRLPSQMSGGQQQRVGIARALVKEPKIIFADEPTGNLDSKTTLDVINFILDIASSGKITIIMVTHDPSLANYADKIVELKDGKIIDYRVNNNKKLIQEGV